MRQQIHPQASLAKQADHTEKRTHNMKKRTPKMVQP
jgi:hypothetical protein